MKLSNDLNWQVIWQGTWSVDYLLETQELSRYIPLKQLEVQTVSPIVSIDIVSLKEVRPTWRIGGWVEIYSKILENKNHRLEDRKPIRLNSANLYHFKTFNLPIPYVLQLNFPFWLEVLRLKVQCYIDQSGRYLDENISDLAEEISGKNYTLQRVTYARNSEDPSLVDSIFTVDVPMERYRIGRFREIDTGKFLPDPIIKMNPYLLILTFTSDSPVPSGKISVDIGL